MSTTSVARAVVTRAPARTGEALREIGLLGTVFVLYELGRLLVREREVQAFANAKSVLDVQKGLPLPRETTVQEVLLQSESLVRAANVFYVSVHFPVTIAFLVLTWWKMPAVYAWGRRLLVATTLVAMLLHVVFPLAPPRMMPGFVDTMAVFGPSAYGEGTQSVTNQYAAMPSLHAAWAIVIGLVLVRCLRSRWRWLALLHPLLTTLVIVGTANHYWLDVLAAAVLVLLAALVFHAPLLQSRGPTLPAQAAPTA